MHGVQTIQKIPPYSVHAEKVVLGSMMADRSLIEPIRAMVGEIDVFFRPEHGRLYRAIVNWFAEHETDDRRALLVSLAKLRLLDADGSEAKLRELLTIAEEPPAALAQARLVVEKARMRDLIDAISDILHDAYHSGGAVDEILKRARSRLDVLAATAPEAAAFAGASAEA